MKILQSMLHLEPKKFGLDLVVNFLPVVEKENYSVSHAVFVNFAAAADSAAALKLAKSSLK